MARVALVEPGAPGTHLFSRFRLPRLGLPSIGAVLTRAGHAVRIYCEGVLRVALDHLRDADIVGISTTTSTAPRAYEIADFCRAAGIPTVIGGPHATFMLEEALEHADYCVRGEGEVVFPQLVERLEARAPVSDLPGVLTRDGGSPSTALCRVPDLDTLPFPDLRLIEGWREQPIMPVMTSRGCPHKCRFCSVTAMFGRRYRFRSPQSVIEELKWLQPRRVFFYDDDFCANRQRTRELLEQMLRQDVTPPWTAQVRADVARDRELVALMHRARCRRVYVGYESISPTTLAAMGKHQSVEDIVESVRVFHEHGIGVHGMFMFGSDEDDAESVQATLAFARRHEIDTVQFMALTPLPGTPVFDSLSEENRLFERDWSFYDGHHVVFLPRRLTPLALQQAICAAQERFYSWWACVKDFAQLRFGNGFLKAYGRCLLGRWRRENVAFLSRLHQIAATWTGGSDPV